jgi:signal transduction histidine kinase
LLQRGAAGNVLVIEDDGVGFDVTLLPSATGLGLVGMEERARGLGGRLDVRSTPGQGTRVAVTW